MQVQVASSSLVLRLFLFLFTVNTITRTQLFSRAEQRTLGKRGYLSHPGYFSGKFGHLYSAEDFSSREKNGSNQDGVSSSTTSLPLYTVSPTMFRRGSNLRHAAARDDSTESEDNFKSENHHHDGFPHVVSTATIYDIRNSGLKGNKGRQKIAKLPQVIPYYERNNDGSYYKKGKGIYKPPVQFTIPPAYTKTTEPVHNPTEQVTNQPTSRGIEIFTTYPTTPGIKKGKGHHKPATMFTIPPEYTQTTELVHYQTDPVISHPQTTQEVYITQPITLGIKEGKGHQRPASKFTIPPEYTRTTEPIHYPTETVYVHPTTTEKEFYTVHQTTTGINKGKGHHKTATMFTIPPEYTQTTEPDVHHQTEQVTMHPTATEEEIYTLHPTTSRIKKGKGNQKPASKFTIPPEYTKTTEPVYYPTEQVAMHPTTTDEEEIYTFHQTTPGIKKGEGHHKPASKFTIPSEYTRTTESVHYPTEPVTSYPETTEEIHITQPTTSVIKKGKGHHILVSKFTIPPEYTRTTELVHYPTKPVTLNPATSEEVHITLSTPWVKKGKGHHKPVSKFTVPPEYTMSTQSGYPSRSTTLTNDMPQTHKSIGYDQSTFPVEFSTLMKDTHKWKTSTIKYSDSTYPYHKDEQSIDDQFTVSEHEGMISENSEIGNPEVLVTDPSSFSTEAPIKYEVFTPETYQITQKYGMTPDFQTTKYPNYKEFSTRHTTPSMQYTEPSHYQYNYHNDDDQATVPVEKSSESSTKYPHYEEFSTTYKGPMQYTEDDQATVPVYISSESSTKYPHYEEFPTTYKGPVQYTENIQATVPVEIPSESSTKYPHYGEFSTTYKGPMQYTEDDQATVPVYISSESSTKYPHYEGFSNIYKGPMQYTEDDQATVPVYISSESSTKYPHYEEFPTTYKGHMQYTEDDQATVPVEIPSESSTKYPYYDEYSIIHTDSSMQNTESSQYHTDMHMMHHADVEQATGPVEIPSESSTKNPHYEFSTQIPMQYTKPSLYHSIKDSDDQAIVPVEVAIGTTTQMPSHHIESTSSYKQSTEFDSDLQAKVPVFPSENDEQHHLDVDFSDEEDADQQSITHPHFSFPEASTQANSPSELDWRSDSTVDVIHNKKYTVAPSDFFLKPIPPFKPVEFIPPQPYKEWPSHSSLNVTGIEQVKVPDTIQVDLKGYPSYAENRPGIKGRGGRHNMISKPWYFMSRTFH